MNRCLLVAATDRVQVCEDTVRDEGCKRSSQLHYGLQAGVECLVSRQLVIAHATTPETLAVKTYIPVREVLVYELLNSTCCGCGIVVVKILGHILHKCVQHRDDPAVDLGTLSDRYLTLLTREAIYVGVESKERVGVVERAEELTTHLVNAILVEFEVIPGL